MADERWKPVPASRLLGVPPGYEASSLGRIRGGRGVLALQQDRDGYGTVKLGRRRFRVCVLVQLAFAGLPEVRHLDDDRGNDTPGNLEWGSRWRNERDKRKRRVDTKGVVTVPSHPVTDCNGGSHGS